ncbi:MAG: BrnT family toxin [Gammaproteobacteria bacterium]|nr:BrnT family toxin [Gammaproteobacteria bacterium]
MKIDFDPAKSEKNTRERGLPFDLAEDFEWDSALVVQDTRNPYPESRFQAIGFIDEERLHVLIFTLTPGGIRVISLRKANAEVNRYEKAQETQS